MTTRAPEAVSEITRFYQAGGGAAGMLGRPVSAEVCGLRDGGCFRHFQDGSIYASPGTGPQAVLGSIATAHAAARGEAGPLGYPVGGRYATPGNGWTQGFQFGRIHFSPATGSHAVHGDISKAYDPMWGESGVLGYPVSARYATAAGGVTQAFQNGRIHWSAATGGHAVWGTFTPVYDALHGESGPMGYPLGAAYPTPGGGWTQPFQSGRIHFSPATGSHAVHGEISRAYDRLRGESGVLGYPVGPQRPVPGGVEQGFQQGRITVVDGRATVVTR